MNSLLLLIEKDGVEVSATDLWHTNSGAMNTSQFWSSTPFVCFVGDLNIRHEKHLNRSRGLRIGIQEL